MNEFVYDKNTHSVVVYNVAYGGFRLSRACRKLLPNNLKPSACRIDNMPLLTATEVLGFKAAGDYNTNLKAALVPRDARRDVIISEYDGCETVTISETRFVCRMLNEHFARQCVMTKHEWKSIMERSENLKATDIQLTEIEDIGLAELFRK